MHANIVRLLLCSGNVVSGVQVQDVLQGVGIVADVGAGIGLSGGCV
jgi:hypothetical protein